MKANRADMMEAAGHAVRNKGAPGPDGMTAEEAMPCLEKDHVEPAGRILRQALARPRPEEGNSEAGREHAHVGKTFGDRQGDPTGHSAGAHANLRTTLFVA